MPQQINPFSLTFGKEPRTIIPRPEQTEAVINAFSADNPASSAFVITGVRGSGKTVTLSKIGHHFSNEPDWIVIELNPETDMLEYFAAAIYEKIPVKFPFLKKEFSFSFHGLTFSISGEKPVSNVITLLEKMLGTLKKNQKRVLVCIDDVSSNPRVRAFAHQFQIFLRADYPIFLLMTGLFENVRSLQNEKSLTFLYRALQIHMSPLSLPSIADSFQTTLGVERADAVEMAKLTKGYAFAYQVLGYVMFEKKRLRIDGQIIAEFDRHLRQYAYEKLFYDLPDAERVFLYALGEAPNGEIAHIIKTLGVKNQDISPTRDRLLRKGIIVSPEWGKLKFALPRFKEFLDTMRDFI